MYTREFIEKVKRVYPDSPMIIDAAERGLPILGRYLDESSCSGFSSRFTALSHEELMTRARIMQARQEVYSDWFSGRCYSVETREEEMCPAYYMQNNGDKDRYEFEAIACKEVGWVSTFSSCKNWSCKQKCWQKYYEFKDGIRR